MPRLMKKGEPNGIIALIPVAELDQSPGGTQPSACPAHSLPADLRDEDNRNTRIGAQGHELFGKVLLPRKAPNSSKCCAKFRRIKGGSLNFTRLEFTETTPCRKNGSVALE